jgi:hypothetical protein
MKKNLADVLESLFEDKKTGILSITVSSEKNLYKFYFKNGQIYHLSSGFKKGKACLNDFLEKEPVSCSFVPQVSVDIISNDIPSTEEIIKKLKKMNRFVSFGDDASAESSDFIKIKEGLKVALIKQIGPIGGKIVEKIIQEKWTPSSPPVKEDFIKLIDLLKDEIDDPLSRKEFLTDANKLI